MPLLEVEDLHLKVGGKPIPNGIDLGVEAGED